MEKTKTQTTYLQIGNLVIVIATIFINILANLLPLNNLTTKELSDSLPNLFVPAGLTFAIWGVIYLLLLVFAIYQARGLFSDYDPDLVFLEKINYWLIVNGLSNIAWIFLWHYEQVLLSTLALAVVFISLLMIYLNLNIGKEDVLLTEKLAVHLPFSVYFGWASVAIVAGITATFVDLDLVSNNSFLGIAEGIWTIFIIIVVIFIALAVIYDRADIGYSLVISWALLGIYLKRSTDDPIYGVRNDIAMVAILGAIIVLAALIIRYVWDYYQTKA